MGKEWAARAVCDDDFEILYPGRIPVRVRDPETGDSDVEICVFCGEQTPSGIYVRLHRDEAPFAESRKPGIPGVKVIRILVEECGWRLAEHDAQQFLYHYPTIEYRFQGALGFGGKFWINDGRMYVNCYREDETSSRLGMIGRANRRLADLIDRYKEVESAE